jgi:hypothetical protein
MTFLEGFEYDVFVSYGWAGAEKVDEGDRVWVNLFQQKVTLEMRARLGGRFGVFFDDYSQRNGFLYKNLEHALEKSGTLLFIVSPGSCRADSWCRYELRRFLDQAQPVAHPGVPRAERLFKAELRRVDSDGQPPPLDKIVPYRFVHPRFNTPVTVERLDDQESEAFGEFQKLRDDLESLFKKAGRLQKSGKPSSGKTIFCGAVHTELADTLDRLVNNQDNNGHHVLLATPVDGEDPGEFQLRSHTAITRASCSVHLFGGAGAFEPAIVQCTTALRSAIPSVYVWQNRDSLEPNAAHFLETISAAYLKSGRLYFPQGGADSYLDANLGFDLAPQASPSLPKPSPTGLTALVQFDTSDQINLQIVAKRLQEKNFHVQPPIFGGTKSERQSLNEGLYRQAQKVVVLFGETQDFWAFQTCSEVANALGRQLTPARAALVLAPPAGKPPSKPFFSFPQFHVIQCSDPNWTNQFDQWADAPFAGSGQ